VVVTSDVRARAATSLTDITFSLADLGFELRRAWPRSENRLLLDLRPEGPEESRVAGQWFRDADQARTVAAATLGATCSGAFVLQPGGADRTLKSLRDLLGDPGAELVSHRAEQRAVLRSRPRGETVFTKVVAVKRQPALRTTARIAEALPLRTPRVRAANLARGTVTTDALPGRPLHELLPGTRAQAACVATGAALAALHRIPAPDGLTVHSRPDEEAVTTKWHHLAAAFGAQTSLVVRVGREDLDPGRGSCDGPRALIHRDFHDKQVLVAEDNSVGILDFDSMATGDPALDLANVLVHLDLRCRQGWIDDAGPLRQAILRGYEPTVRTAARVPAYEALAWRRLGAVYAFRPTTMIT
jgi:aminoglycoside phosphotransferase (APT) family kinase protein